MDQLNRDILACLKDRGRISDTELAEKVGISRNMAAARRKALEQKGVIRGYTTKLDAAEESEGLLSLLIMETKPFELDRLKEKLKEEESVIALCQLSDGNTLCAVCVSYSNQCAAEKIVWNYKMYEKGIIRMAAYGIKDIRKGGFIPGVFAGM